MIFADRTDHRTPAKRLADQAATNAALGLTDRSQHMPSDTTITKRVEQSDGSELMFLSNGAVWIIHPVTGPARLQEPTEVAAS